jgi:hypothetical protein
MRDSKGPLCEIEGTQVQCHGQNDGLGCRYGNVVAADKGGAIWVGDAGKVCFMSLEDSEKLLRAIFPNYPSLDPRYPAPALEPISQGSADRSN